MCMTASQIRAELLNKRSSLSEDLVLDASNRVIERVLNLAEYQSSRVIGSYCGVRGEIDPSSLLSSSEPQHALPVVESDGKLSFIIPDGPLKNGSYGIPEPVLGLKVDPEDLDMVLVPLVAADLSGNRIGHGAGFYDKTFSFRKSESSPYLVGLAHEFQIVESLDPEPWDIPLDVIVTEKTIYEMGMNHIATSMGED
ncbi:MAG: 5-formyltetrahydrofolate cyclo-ligase [Actinobacteria bacterium]|nr:5-formyltetrahydrofolate cyclo-ligase [Actinomycetota bacterium]